MPRDMNKRPMGPRRGLGPMMADEKAKDFKGTMKTLFHYLKADRVSIFFFILKIFK